MQSYCLPEFVATVKGLLKSVYARHVYNVRACSFYYIKWRHLANLLLLDNAILKLKRNG